MNQVFKSIMSVFFIALSITVCMGIYGVCAKYNNAKDFKNAAVDEIENSNFSSSVIAECQTKATENEYTLSVKTYSRDNGNAGVLTGTDTTETYMAEVTLTYPVKIPLTGNVITVTMKGMAR